MQEIIKIDNTDGKQTVNARDLHEFLEVKSRFNDWFNNRVKTYDFVDGQDFTSVTKNLVVGNSITEHYISIDMAKELSMVERNKKGKEARQYFIECEKKLQEMPLITDPRQQALLLAQSVIELNKTIEEQQPAVEFAAQMAANKDSIKIGDFAKILFNENNLVIGQNRLFSWLRQNGYLQSDNKPYQRFLDKTALFQVVTGVIDGTSRIWSTTKVTGKGIVYLTQKIIESGEFKPIKTPTITKEEK